MICSAGFVLITQIKGGNDNESQNLEETAQIATDNLEETAIYMAAGITHPTKAVNADAQMVMAVPMEVETEEEIEARNETTRILEQHAQPEHTFVPYEMFTNCYANLRDEPSTEGKLMDTLAPNVEVEVVDTSGEWSEVRVDDSVIGYIRSDLLSKEETPVEDLNRWGIALTKDEIDLLANIVYLESHIDTMEGKEAVVEIVFNRIAFSDSFEDDLLGVLSERHQFETWPIRWKASPTQDEYDAIYHVMYGQTYRLSPEYVYFARQQVDGHSFIRVGKYHWFSKE